MLKHLYKSHVRESLSPTKIRYNSVNYPIIVQIIRKCSSWCTKVYLLEDDYIILYSNWTPLVTLTIRIVRSKVFCEEPAILWSTMRIYWWIYWRIYGSFINGSRKWSPNTRTYVFFLLFHQRVSETQRSEICTWSFLMWFHTGSVLICCWGCNTRPLKSTWSREWFE